MEHTEIQRKLRSAILCLQAHPDNEPHSEFADRIEDLEEILKWVREKGQCSIPDVGNSVFMTENQIEELANIGSQHLYVGATDEGRLSHGGVLEIIKRYNAIKPPLGLIPKIFHDERVKAERFNEVCEAIARYYDAGLKINIEWIVEYNELVDCIRKQ